MTKSRRLPALLFVVLCDVHPTAAQTGLAPAAPNVVTADEAMAIAQERTRAFIATECPPGRGGEQEVIVCGRRPGLQRYRVPTTERDLGAGSRDRAAAAQLDAMAANSERCSPVGRDNGCGGGLDIFGIGFAILRAVRQALANRD